MKILYSDTELVGNLKEYFEGIKKLVLEDSTQKDNDLYEYLHDNELTKNEKKAILSKKIEAYIHEDDTILVTDDLSDELSCSEIEAYNLLEEYFIELLVTLLINE